MTEAEDVAAPGGLPARSARARVAGLALVAVVSVAQAAYWNAPVADLGEASTLVIALAFAAVFAVRAGRSGEEPEERLFWRMFTACGSLVLAGRVYLAVVPDGLRAPSPATYLDLAAALVFLVNLALTTRFRSAALGARLRYLTDLASGLVAAFIVSFAVVLPGPFDAAGLSHPERISASVYLAAGLLMVFGTLGNLIARGRRTAWEVFLSTGFGVAGFALALWPFWYVDVMTPSVWVGTPLIEVLWVLGVGLLGCSALFRVTSRDVAWRPQFVTGAWKPRSPAFLGWALSLITVPVFGLTAVPATGIERAVLVHGTLILCALAVARATIVVLATQSRARWSDVDPLTGLYSRSVLRQRLAEEIALVRRLGEPLAVAMFDVDDFAYVNQSVGYPRGDLLIRRMARVMEGLAGPNDVVCRIEGDTFVVMLSGSGDSAAVQYAEEARARIAARLGLNVSVGVAHCPRHADEPEALLRLAKEATRLAKCEGKDCVVVYDEQAVAALSAEERLRLLEEGSRVEILRLVAHGVDERHPLTTGHSRRVADLSAALGRRIGLSRRRVRLLRIAALVHDVGKVGLPDSALGAAGLDAEEERRLIREHAELSARIVSATGLSEVAQWVEAHHERWDGSGYPNGLAGESVPLEARILSLCSAFDTLRRGDDPSSVARACSGILAGRGSAFDPILADRLITMVTERLREVS